MTDRINTTNPEFNLVDDMEDDLAAIDDFAAGLQRIAQSLDGESGDVVFRIATSVRERYEAVKVRQQKLWELLRDQPATIKARKAA